MKNKILICRKLFQIVYVVQSQKDNYILKLNPNLNHSLAAFTRFKYKTSIRLTEDTRKFCGVCVFVQIFGLQQKLSFQLIISFVCWEVPKYIFVKFGSFDRKIQNTFFYAILFFSAKSTFKFYYSFKGILRIWILMLNYGFCN